MEATTKPTIRQQAESYWKRYEKYFPAFFFVAGFLFDIVTLSRIDDWLSIAQQGLYILILIQILKFKTLEAGGAWTPREKWAKWWHYSNEVLHFFLGSLLSSYTLFYFVSSSLSTSFIFMIVIFALLVGNELPQLQNRDLRLKYALFSICLFSFLFIVVPITLGFIGIIPFLLAITIGVGLHYALFQNLNKRALQNINVSKTMLYPPLIVAVLLLSLYIFKLLPPIPLSVQYMGIYHQIEKIKAPGAKGWPETKFILKYDRPAWKFWQNGDQDFLAEPGDKIHCFVRIFAPAYFKDKVVFHWLKKYPNGWQSVDKITNEISGGRDEGFRGYAVKSNFDPGQWRVQVETTDGREIGRIGFRVTLEPTPNLVRQFRTDEF